MGAAAGKQFQSEKAKHAQAVLSAVELFEQSNHQEQESYGGISTEFFKKRVMLAASDAKRKGKDIEKSLAQLTDADMDMLAHYAENRKAEMRRQGAASNTMQVEEIFDEENGNAENGENGGDNVDETTSVLSYGDDEEEAAENDNDDLDSSGEILENIEEVVETRPRLNSGYKVFPMGGEEENSKAAGENNNGSNQKSKLKLEEATVRSGIADHFAKFWEYDEPGSLASQGTHGAGLDSPHSGALSPNSTQIGKKFQPSPKQSFPYKDRGQRIDERNETLMVLQRQKVISLTQNAQLEREVEALQRQLEKMDAFDQTFANTSKTAGSLGNTGNSSNTITPGNTSKFAQNTNAGMISGRSDLSSSGYGSGNVQGKYSYIYPIDEEISFQPHEHRSRGEEHKKAESKASAGSVGGNNGNGSSAGILNPHRRRTKDRAAKGSSPSSSDNDSVNSYSNNAAGGGFNKNALANANAHANASANNGSGKARAVAGGSQVGDLRAQGKGGILRVKSNDQSDLSDDMPSAAPTQPALGKVGKAHSSFVSNAGAAAANAAGGVMAGSSAQSGSSKPKRVRIGASATNEVDSDDSTQLIVQNSRHVAGYNPSHPSSHPSVRNNGGRGADAASIHAQAKHANESDSENHESNISRSTRPQVLKSKRVVNVSVRSAVQNSNSSASAHQQSEGDAKRRGSDNDVLHDQSPTATVTKMAHSPGNGHDNTSYSPSAASRARRLTQPADDAKQVSSPARLALHRDREHQSPPGQGVVVPGDPRYQALLDNVSMHLEAVRKDTEAVVGGAGAVQGGGGSNKGPARNHKGGALKKLNKRRHSMDALEDSAGNGHNNISNTDTSQDEVDASSPNGKYKRYGQHRAGSNGAAAGADASPGTHRSPQGTQVTGGESYITTDDESVGPGAARSKLRRPRAKAHVPSGSPPSASASAASAGAPQDGNTAAEAGDGYHPSHASHPSKGADSAGGAVSNAEGASTSGAGGAGAAAGADGDTASSGVTVAKVKRRAPRVQVASKSAKDAAAAAPANASGPWDSELDQWWAEVSLLLRKPILQEEDMLYTVAAAEAGLIYTEEMNEVAQQLNVLRGALSRWILPYDNNTRIEDQCSTPHSVVENMPAEFRGKLTERQVHYLVAGANGVRKLIRVKIADDNDLEQARKALKSTDMFFKALYHRAKEASLTPYSLLQMANN